MRAISLWQPWASLLARGPKWIETRPNPYPWRAAIGTRLAIHATLKAPFLIEGMALADLAIEAGWPDLPLGAVLATADLVDVVPMVKFHSRGPGDEPTFPWTPYDGSGIPPFPMLALNHDASTLTLHRGQLHGGPRDVTDQKPYGDFAPGRSALIFDDITPLYGGPVPARGRQGLWTWDE